MMTRSTMRQRGFTLVEAVMVIVIIGVLGGMVAVFLRTPIQSYADSVGRAELSDVADLALRRMARDLRLALPNSIRVNPAGDAIEFLMTRSGGRYLAAEDGDDTLPELDFIDDMKKTLAVVGPMPALTVNQDYLVVNNLGPGYAPANAWDLELAQHNIARVVGAVSNQLTLDHNPFGKQDPPSPSPDKRFHIVTGPVTYACAPAAGATARQLTRQAGYQIKAIQVDNPAGGTRSTLAGRVLSCNFQYQTLASQPSGLVILTLELLPRNGTGAAFRLVHQVHVDNTP